MAMYYEMKLRCKAFGRVELHDLRVSLPDKEVRVWDTVAGHYTLCHGLGRAAIRRAVGLAREQHVAQWEVAGFRM